MKKIFSDPKRLFYWLLIALTTIGAIGWLVNTWYYSDDYCYSREVVGNEEFWDCVGEPITSWNQVMPSVVNHYLYLNGRLANAVLFPLQMFPRWVGMGIAGVLIGAFLWVLYHAGRLDRSRVSLRWLALGPALLWIVLPWYENFQSMAYQYNYVPASICMLTVLYLMRDAAALSRRRLWIAVVAGVFTGLLHEGFAGTLGVALCVMWLMERGVARRRIGYVIIATGIGMAVCVLSGTIARISNSVDEHDGWYLRYMITRYLQHLWMLWLAMGLWALYAWRHRGTDSLRRLNHVALPLLAGIVANLAIAVVMQTKGRVLWPAMLCCIVIIMIIASEWIGSTRPRRGAVIVMSAATALYALWLGGVVYWECRVSEMQRNFAERASQPGVAGSSVAFTDMDTMKVPFWTMELATNEQYECAFFGMTVDSHFRISGTGMMAIYMPMSCQDKTYEEFDTVPGTAGMRGHHPYLAVDSLYGEPSQYMGLTTYRNNALLTLGEPTIECTPIERAAFWIKKQLGIDVYHIKQYYIIYPVTVDGVQRGRVFIGNLPIGFNNREVLRIDHADEL